MLYDFSSNLIFVWLFFLWNKLCVFLVRYIVVRLLFVLSNFLIVFLINFVFCLNVLICLDKMSKIWSFFWLILFFSLLSIWIMGFCIDLKLVFSFEVIDISIVFSVLNLYGKLFVLVVCFCWSFFCKLYINVDWGYDDFDLYILNSSIWLCLISIFKCSKLSRIVDGWMRICGRLDELIFWRLWGKRLYYFVYKVVSLLIFFFN